jgi:hypothetical protein
METGTSIGAYRVLTEQARLSTSEQESFFLLYATMFNISDYWQFVNTGLAAFPNARSHMQKPPSL